MIDDNPYQAPRTTLPSSTAPVRDHKPLRRSLAYFGAFSVLAHIGVAPITDRLAVDLFGVLIFLVGACGRGRINPWLSVLFATYPLMFFTGLFAPDGAQIQFWLVPTRGMDPPHILYLVLAVWALTNVALIIQGSWNPQGHQFT